MGPCENIFCGTDFYCGYFQIIDGNKNPLKGNISLLNYLVSNNNNKKTKTIERFGFCKN